MSPLLMMSVESAGLNGLTISTNDFNAVDLKVGGTISITNTGTSSEITGVIAMMILLQYLPKQVRVL